jgi:transposase-like protein
VRWYVAYPVSYRQIEEMMGEHGVEVDHSTLHRWVLKYVPALEKAFLARKRPVGGSWRLDETYVRIKGAWKYLYRAVDKAGATVDFLLTAKRDRKAAGSPDDEADIADLKSRGLQAVNGALSR